MADGIYLHHIPSPLALVAYSTSFFATEREKAVVSSKRLISPASSPSSETASKELSFGCGRIIFSLLKMFVVRRRNGHVKCKITNLFQLLFAK